MNRAVAICPIDEIEVLDLGGRFEVFSTVSRLEARLAPAAARPFEVFTVAETLRTARARGGPGAQPAFDFANHPKIDVLIVPGGVVSAEWQRPAVIEWLRGSAARAGLVASVCTDAFPLAEAGLLQGRTNRLTQAGAIGRGGRLRHRCAGLAKPDSLMRWFFSTNFLRTCHRDSANDGELTAIQSPR